MKKMLVLVLMAIVATMGSTASALSVDFTAAIEGIDEDPYTYDKNADGIVDAAQLYPLAYMLATNNATALAVWNANQAVWDEAYNGVNPVFQSAVAPFQIPVMGLLCIGDAASLAVIDELNADYGAFGLSIEPNPAAQLSAFLSAGADPDADLLTNLQEWQLFGAATDAGFLAYGTAAATPVAALSAVSVSGPATAIEGLSVTLTATATGGTPPLVYTWKKGATTVGTGQSLSLSGLTVADSGDYTCSVTDSAATPVTVTSAAHTLTVDAIPMPVMGVAGLALLAGLAGALGVRKIRK